MIYSDYIEINEVFQASVNLEYDLNKREKVRSYIPTEQSVKVLGTFLRSFYYNKDPQNRASVLIGPYGRGKSHLLLVLSALTSIDVPGASELRKDEARIVQHELCAKIERVDKEVGALAKAIVDSNIRTLPVIINSNTNDINQSFLISIYDALTKANLQSLLPTTYFDSAISVIDKWKDSFPDAFKKLAVELKKTKYSIDELYIGLKQFDRLSYELFCKAYPVIAAGTEFNPLTNMDVVKLYLAVTNALCVQTKYSGINIIFDEFSKFLEANLDKSRMLNFKIIQDMAEAATRSGQNQIHFTCVTHKDILDYSLSDSFKTVEGRFSKIQFVSSSEQSYELIANAIIKKMSFDSLKNSLGKEFERVINASSVSNIFGDLTSDTFEKKLVYGCFPLTPLSAFALLHISEIVGQNERSLFTFLAQNDAYTLASFIHENTSSIRFLTVDYIYSYFEDLFKKEIFNSVVHSVWAKTHSAMLQINDPDQLKILKAIAVINIIADDRLKTTAAHIKAVLMMDDDVFDNAARELLKQHILSKRDSSEYVLLTANGVDIQNSVENYVKLKISKINYCNVLNEYCDLGYVMPREYNDKFSMLRYFKKIYMEAGAFLKYLNAQQVFSEYPYDGLIIHIIEINSAETENILKKIHSFRGVPQLVLCLSKHAFEYEDLLKKAVAIKQLRLESGQTNDPHYVEEIEIFEEDIKRQICSVVDMMYAPNSENSYFVNCDGELSVSKQVELNHEISRICSGCYNKTPVVNNEMVNKSILNAQNLKGRDLVVDWILAKSDANQIPCMGGFGPEVSIFKSVFKHTGLDGAGQIVEQGVTNVLEVITRFITGCERQKGNFSTLYQELTSVPYGMRRGIIPLFIAYAMRPYKENIVLYFKGKEVELSAAIMSSMNEAPENYQLLIEAGTHEREIYLDALAAMFSPYADSKITSVNRVYGVVKSMQNWVRALPEYTKKFRNYLDNGESILVDTSVDVVRSELLKFEVNSRELLFNTLITKLSPTGNTQECVRVISTVKRQLDDHITKSRVELTKKLTALFMPGYQGGLSHSVISWYQSLPDTTKKHIFDVNTNALLSLAGDVSSYDDEKLLDQLINSFASIAIEDWGDSLACQFESDIASAIGRINEYREVLRADAKNCKVEITLTDTKIEKTFSASQISPLGKTVLNNLRSVFDEYNGSIDPNEQLAIIAKLIEDVIY